MSESEKESPDFPSPVWPLVQQAASRMPHSREAMEELLRRYLPALRAHLVEVEKLNPHDADDVVQGFVHDKLLKGKLLARADESRGKFRTYLLTALDRYITDQWRRNKAKKRTFERGAPERTENGEEPVGPATSAADAFHIEWARSTLHEALRRMEAECAEKGRPDLWGTFEHRVLSETLGSGPTLSYDELVERYGFRSPAQASNALMTAKRMFARALRSVLAEYSQGSDAEIEAELRDLQMILEKFGARSR